MCPVLPSSHVAAYIKLHRHFWGCHKIVERTAHWEARLDILQHNTVRCPMPSRQIFECFPHTTRKSHDHPRFATDQTMHKASIGWNLQSYTQAPPHRLRRRCGVPHVGSRSAALVVQHATLERCGDGEHAPCSRVHRLHVTARRIAMAGVAQTWEGEMGAMPDLSWRFQDSAGDALVLRSADSCPPFGYWVVKCQ